MLTETVELPGTTDTNKKGDYVDARDETTHLTRHYAYNGRAWYQHEVEIPATWKGQSIYLFLERTKPSEIYVDGKLMGTSNDISTPQVFDLSAILTPGRHKLAIMIDNGSGVPEQLYASSHAYTEDTQTNWNGIIGEICLTTILPQALLVAKTEILQVKGSGMTGISTHLCPFVGSGIAIGPLDEIDSLSHPFVHLRHRHHILCLVSHTPTAIGSLATHTTRQDGKWLHTEVFTELEVLKVTQTHALMVAPSVLQTATLFLRADGGLPTVGIPETIATTMHDASAGEAHELRLEVGQCLCEVGTQTMTLEGVLRHERHHIYIEVAGVEHEDLEGGILTGAVRCQHGTVFLPRGVADVELGLSQEFRLSGPEAKATPLRLCDQCDTNPFGKSNSVIDCNIPL